jgi:hypothetical protein
VSPLRRLSTLWRWDRRFVRETRGDAFGDGQAFWQSVFGAREFSRLLRRAGFRVDGSHPYVILFGLYDLPLLPTLLEGRAGATAEGRSEATQPAPQVPTPRPASLLKRLLVSEDRSIAGLGDLVEVARRLCASMMMFVCTR